MFPEGRLPERHAAPRWEVGSTGIRVGFQGARQSRFAHRSAPASATRPRSPGESACSIHRLKQDGVGLTPGRIRSSIWSTLQPYRSEPEHGEARALTSRGISRISSRGFHGPDWRMDLPSNKQRSSGARWPDLPAAPRLRKRRCSVAPRNALCRLGRLLVISIWGSRKAHACCDERQWSGSGGYPVEGRGFQRGTVWRQRLDTR